MSDNIEQTIEYQEQILDDLDDIKGSLDEESDYFDKEYQKEVLSSLKSLQKSVDSFNQSDSLDYVTLNFITDFNTGSIQATAFSVTDITFKSAQQAGTNWYHCYDISDYDFLNIITSAYGGGLFLSNDTPSQVAAYTSGSVHSGYMLNLYTSDNISTSEYYEIPDGYTYLYTRVRNTSNINHIPVVKAAVSSSGDDPLPEEPVEVVTTSSAVIIEGLDNLTQITTFQSFCSSLLIGILLFLVFVKGLRK